MIKAIEAEDPLALGARRIRELREKRASLVAERPRLAALVRAADVHAGEIERLQRTRIEAVALALIDVSEANTGAIDARIVEAERAAAQALSDGEVAQAALALVDEHVAALNAELEAAQTSQLEAAARDLGEQRRAAYASYNAAVAALREPVMRLMALDAASAAVRERQAQLAGNPCVGRYGGFGDVLVTALRDKGLHEILIARFDTRMPPWLNWQQVSAGGPAFCTEFFVRAGLD